MSDEEALTVLTKFRDALTSCFYGGSAPAYVSFSPDAHATLQQAQAQTTGTVFSVYREVYARIDESLPPMTVTINSAGW